jgi:hypothetical protein
MGRQKNDGKEYNFKAGNQFGVSVGPIIPHPLYPGRDTHGHMLPRHYACQDMEEIRQVLLSSLTPARVQLMSDRLFELCQSKDEKISISALALAYQYFMGKPSQKVDIRQATVSMSKEQLDEMMKAASLT